MRTNKPSEDPTLGFLSGGGEMGMRIRSYDWSQTSLGPVDSWPQSLRTTISIIINSKFPMFLFWGEDHICFYNDAYCPSLGSNGKHPFALGKKGVEVWPEIWNIIKPMIDQVLSGGEAIWNDGQLLPIYRNGKIEDVYWAYSYSAVKDESGKPAGVFATCTETKDALYKESLKRFLSMAENSPVMIWETDAEGLCTYLNKQWLDYTGQTIEESLGLGWLSALHPDDREETARQFEEANRNQQPTRMEYRLRNRDGSYQWMLDDAVPLHDELGRFKGNIGCVVNINKRKLAEQALEEIKTRLEIATTAANVGIWTLDVKTSKVEWSLLHKKMWGYDEHHKEVTDEDWSRVILPGDKERTIQKMDEALKLHTYYDAHYRIKRADDGETRWMRSVGKYFYNDEGEPEIFTGVTIDITEQKLAEERIRESEERFRLLADQAPMWVWMADENIRVTYSNKELLRFVGLSHYTELTNQAWEGFVHSGDIALIYKVFNDAIKKQKPFTIELHVKNAATGKYEWFLVKGVPRLEQNKGAGFIGTAVNINQQKKQLKALAESEQLFRTLADTLPHLVWMTDEKGRQIFTSSRWKEYTGMKPKGMEEWVQMVHPDDLDATVEAWQHSLQTGDAYRAEARLKNKTGDYIWYSVRGLPILDEKGKIIRWIGAFVDIHDQKTLSQKLEDLVTNRTKELQRSNEDLQQFAYVASHDLKEPVRKIKTFIGRLQQEIGEQLDERAQMYINRTLNAANRMIVMIDGVLTYSTISALEEMFEPVNLNEVMKSVELDLELLIQQKGATIRYHNLPTLEGAPILLHQLFYNLVNNALKFTRPDVPPVITISATIEKAEDAEQNNREFAHIIVQDNGIGFDEEDAALIFGTFSRLHPKDKYEGSGLGLALCKNIVEKHGGSISARGKANEGAAFEIILPVKR